jgi:hypothetical protein
MDTDRLRESSDEQEDQDDPEQEEEVTRTDTKETDIPSNENRQENRTSISRKSPKRSR